MQDGQRAKIMWTAAARHIIFLFSQLWHLPARKAFPTAFPPQPPLPSCHIVLRALLNMTSGHAARQWLEAMKFAVYVITPIGATIFLGTGAYPYLEQIILNVRRNYPPFKLSKKNAIATTSVKTKILSNRLARAQRAYIKYPAENEAPPKSAEAIANKMEDMMNEARINRAADREAKSKEHQQKP